jgi:hypothetical protein
MSQIPEQKNTVPNYNTTNVWMEADQTNSYCGRTNVESIPTQANTILSVTD